MSYISHIKVDNTTYDIKDNEAARINSPEFTGTPKAPLPSNSATTQIATVGYVNDAFKANDAMLFKGTIGSSGATVTTLPATHYQGWTYKVAKTGSYAGQTCEVGDMIICVTDGTSANNAHWTIIQNNMTYGDIPSDLELSASTGTSTMIARADHIHQKPNLGNITNEGKISVTTQIDNGDKILISDYDDNNIIKNSSIEFDGLSEDKALTPKGTWGDFYTESEIDEKLDEKENLIIKSVSGDIVFFDDGLDKPVIDVKIDIEPIQDLHGYDYPWPAGGRKNLIPDGTNTENGFVENKYLKPDGTTASSENYGISEYFPVKADTVYGFKKYIGYTINIPSICFYDSEKNYLSGESYNNRTDFTITSPATAAFARTSIHKSYSSSLLFMEGNDYPESWEPYENICPIGGWTECHVTRTGKNVSKPVAFVTQGLTIKPSASEYITQTQTGFSYTDDASNSRGISVLIGYFKAGETFTFSAVSSDNLYRILYTTEYPTDDTLSTNVAQIGDNVGHWTYTAENDGYYWAAFYTSGHTFPVTIDYFQGEYGSTATIYEPYTEAKISITFPTEAGTVYGGTLDMTTGVLTVTHEFIELDGSEDEGWGKYTSSNPYFYWNFAELGYTISNTCISNIYKRSAVNGNTTNIGFNVADSSGGYARIYIRPKEYENMTTDQFRAMLSAQHLQICYQLATPVTYQLTPIEIVTLLGQNIIFADAGNVTIEYLKKNANLIVKYISNEINKTNKNKADTIISSTSGVHPIISDGANELPVESLIAEISPVQDLHGYGHPWPAGGGKNLLNCTQINTSSGTFAGDVSWVRNSDGSFTLNGTATSTDNLILKSMTDYSFPSGDYIVSGCPIDGGANTYRIVLNKNNSESFGTDTGSGSVAVNLADGDVASVYIRVNSGVTISNKTFYPMVRNSSVSDSTYEPYANICPINGRTSARVVRGGVNWFAQESVPMTITSGGVTVTINADGSVTIDGTKNSNAGIIPWNISDSSKNNTNQCDGKKHLPNGTYKLLKCDSRFSTQVYGTNAFPAGTSDVSPIVSSGNDSTFTIDNTYAYNYLRLNIKANSVFHNETFYPMIYKFDEAKVIDVSFPTEAGMVYGGTLDVTTGVLTMTYKVVTFDGVTNGLKFNGKAATATNDNYYWLCPDGNNYEKETEGWYTTIVDPLLRCSHAKYDAYSVAPTEVIYTLYYNKNSGLSLRIVFPLSYGMSSLEMANSWLASEYTNGTPVQIMYKLATPITYQLTSTEVTTLLGMNTIWADTGDVSISYRADTKLHLQSVLTEKSDIEHTHDYLPLSGGTITGDLTIYAEGSTEDDPATKLKFSVKDTTTGKTYDSAYISGYQDHQQTTNGLNMVIRPGGNLFIGGGEYASNHYAAIKPTTTEHTYLGGDSTIYVQANANVIANRAGFQISGANPEVVPCQADIATNDIGSIGTSTCKWANMYTSNINSDGAYVGTTGLEVNGQAKATIFNINNNATMQWNTTDASIDFIFT